MTSHDTSNLLLSSASEIKIGYLNVLVFVSLKVRYYKIYEFLILSKLYFIQMIICLVDVKITYTISC